MNGEFERAASIANSSGFPRQIRVAEIANSRSRWRVLLEEHPWRSEEGNKEGFLDLVLIKSDIHTSEVMVIECKRVRQAEWVFLIPNPEPGQGASQRYPACLWYSAIEEGRWSSFRRFLANLQIVKNPDIRMS